MKIKASRKDKGFQLASTLLVTLLAISIIIPFMNIIAKAFSGYNAVVAGEVGLLPVDFHWSSMIYVLTNKQFTTSFLVSAQVTLMGTFLSLFASGISAYALSKKRLMGRSFFIALFVFTMMFSGGMIPNYMLMKNLGLLNSVWSLFLPGAISVYNMLILKSNFEGVPEALEESATLDGASNMTIFLRIYLPVSLPSLAAVSLFLAVGYWNEYWSALLYITKNQYKPLQLYMLDIIQNVMDPLNSVDSGTDTRYAPESVRAATIIASTVPILLIYPFLQRYFVKGVLVGSVKE